ncbi:MAG: YceH family protein, partial [Ignavibacteriaceae bacterium]|nr:YceH family protein [Ignavibacteriaceae bacterium]
MNFQLSDIEARIIAALIEKEKTTPEYYPMSLNALKNACNQKSNRNPVVNYEENEIEETLEKLRDKKFAMRRTGDDMRVPKYRQTFTETLNLSDKDTAVLTVLMLRGAQTLGEIKSRGSRLFEFPSIEEVDGTITKFSSGDDPFVKKLPRLPGTKESRYV